MPVARRPKPPIVLFSNSWTMGGTEQHLIQLGSGLVARGYTVAAICSPRADVAPLRAELRAAGVRVHTLAERGRGRAAPLARLVNLIRTIHPSQGCTLHIHLTGHIGGELALVAGRLAGARRIIRTEHNPPVPPITARDRWVVRLRDRLLNGVICVSEATREAHVSELRRDPRKCVVVHNGVDLTRFNPAVSGAGVHAEFGLGADMTLVGTVARLAEERKGLADFLRMAAIVAGSHPRTRFVIVGDGPLRPVLEQQAQALGIGDRVIFTGARADVPRLLAAMHSIVIP